MLKDSISQPFNSKIMLFGEYSIICGSMALTIPYSHFNGSLKFINSNQYTDLDFARRSNKQLREYFDIYIKELIEKDNIPASFNYKSFDEDIKDGLYFESSIPEGYGLGSSGALVAAIYDKYVLKSSEVFKNGSQEVDFRKIKKEFALLESWFHGTSSGIDPLICYMRNPFLIKEEETVVPIDIPQYDLSTDAAIFLINSGKPVKTAPLVEQFMSDCENSSYKKDINETYIPLNNGCITSLLNANIIDFEEKLKKLSMFQFDNFKKMIPESLYKLWQKGLDTADYVLKLCGSGGGGFILGFTHFYETAKEEFLKNGFEIIPVYQNNK